MSSTAKVVVPGASDTGKTISYDFGTDQWNLVDFATQAELDAHAGAADPHPGYLTPTEGNAAYWQLSTDLATQVELDAHLNDTVDAHDASAISFVAVGSIVATDVQAAIAEVAVEYIAADTAHAGDVNPHPIYLTQAEGDGFYWPLTTDLATQAELNAHEADSTGIHGVANMAALITKIVTDAIALGSAVEIGNGAQALQIWATANGPIIESKDSQKITIGDGASAVHVDVTNGRVGIGPTADVSAPAAALHVSRDTSGQGTLFRNTNAAGTTGPILKAEAKTVGSRALQTGLDTDTVAQFNIDIDGGLAWGAGGASTRDTNLFRNAADVLRTNDSLIIDGSLTIGADTIQELIRDTMGIALVAGTSISLSVNDGGDTITVATTGLVIGTNVQAFDAELQAIAGLTSAADKLPYFTGSGTATLTDLTTVGRALIDDTSVAAQRVTLAVDKRTTFSNADYTAVATDKFVAQIGTLTLPRTVTLPAANAVNAGFELTISDESGSVTGVNVIIISRAGADTLNGGTTVSIPTAYGSYSVVSDGTSKWTAVAKGTRIFYGTTAPANPSIGDIWLDTT